MFVILKVVYFQLDWAQMKHALVLGAGGFIGSHMVTRLKEENFVVHGVDHLNLDNLLVGEVHVTLLDGYVGDVLCDVLLNSIDDGVPGLLGLLHE